MSLSLLNPYIDSGLSDLTEPMLTEPSDEREEIVKDVNRRKLTRSIWIALVFMTLEIIGGLLASSLAIVADAAHVLSDVSGMAVSLFALDLMSRQATTHYTYGFHQAEIIGALVSVMIVWAMTAVLLVEAFSRFLYLQEVDGGLMVIMATTGLAVNIIMMLTLGHHHNPLSNHSHDHSDGHEHTHKDHAGHSHSHDEEEGETTSKTTNLVMQSAVLHIIGDIVQSVGVLIAALLIKFQPFDLGTTDSGISRWYYADPLCTVVFGLIVMYTTFSTVRQCVRILMHRVPEDINPTTFEEKLKGINNVCCVHDIHVWAVGSSNPLCTAHVVVRAHNDSTQVLNDCIAAAQSMGLHHSTFQIEVEGDFDHHQESFGNVHATSDRLCCDPTNSRPSSQQAVVTQQQVPPVTATHYHKHSHNCSHHHHH